MMKRFFLLRKKRMVENESWFYHIFRKNSVLVHAKTTTSYDTVENAITNFSQFFPTRQSLPIIPDFSREARQTMESHLVESCSIFEVFPRNAKFPTFCGVSQGHPAKIDCSIGRSFTALIFVPERHFCGVSQVKRQSF
jgi:hypothetical protein